MVQFRAGTPVAPVPRAAARLEELARAAARRLLEDGPNYELKGGTLVTGAGGAQVYVVVVERTEEALPTAAQVQRRFKLTPREAEVALLSGRRLSVAEMAETLSVTTHTVRRHVERVLGKLQVARRQDVRAALLALAEWERRAAETADRLEQARRARRVQTAAA